MNSNGSNIQLHKELTSTTVRDQVILENLRKTLDVDRRYMTSHPVLKHLFLRYEAILNDYTPFGYPKARVEPAKMFSDRVNTLSVDIANKEMIKRRKIKRKSIILGTTKDRQRKGKEYFQRSGS